MRSWAIFSVLTFALACIGSAQESSVVMSLVTNRQYLIRNDFIGPDSAMSLATLISNQVPPGSQFIRFDASRQAYLPTITRDRSGSWGPAGTTVLVRGEAYWLRIPPMGGLVTSSQYQVTLTGTIPVSDTVVTSVPLFNAAGYPYPVSRQWTNTQYAKSLPNSSQLRTWNTTNQDFFTATKGIHGWSSSTLILSPGQGFFVYRNSASPSNFTEAVPY